MKNMKDRQRYETVNISPLGDPTIIFAILVAFGPLIFSWDKIETLHSIYGYFTEASLVTVIILYILFELYPQALSFFELFGLPSQSSPINDSNEVIVDVTHTSPNRKNKSKNKKGNNNNNNNNNNNGNNNNSDRVFIDTSSKNRVSLSNDKILLSARQYQIARWYLVNGLFFHCLCDSIAGTHQKWSLMSMAYKELDGRFHEPTSAEGMLASLVTQLEMFVMTPLCLMAYYGYRCHAIKDDNFISNKLNKNNKNNNNNNNEYHVKHEAWVYIVEIIVATLQLVGCYFFYGGEIAHYLFDTGLWKTPFDVNFEFTYYHMVYFWISFCIIPLPWVFVPIYMIRRATKDLMSLF